MQKLSFLVIKYLFFIFLILQASNIYGQQTTGGLLGTVYDETKAVIPGAEVTAKNIDTGLTASTTTNEFGVYRLSALIPGNYAVMVNSPGFSPFETQKVTVRLGIDLTVDVVLQVATLSEQGDLIDDKGSPFIERDTAQLSTNFEGRQVADLPTNIAGGGIDTIALLVPGVVSPNDASFSNENGTNISANGGRGRSNNFSIDGQDNNEITITGPAALITNADIVQEFQIITNNFSAEYGQAGSAIINIVTKGGTNEFHGNLFYFHRDRKLFDTLTLTERRDGKKEADALLNSTFGFTLGGPVVKDRLFFFTSYQGIREAAASFLQSSAGGRTLTPNGIATALQFVSPELANVIKLASPFSIPLGNPAIQPFTTQIIPVTINGHKDVNLEFAGITRTISTPTKENFTTSRIDWFINDRLRLFGRYLYQKNEAINVDFGRTTSGFPSNLPLRNQQAGINLVSIISPRMVNEFRFNYSRFRIDAGSGGVPSVDQADQALTNLVLPPGFLPYGVPNNIPQGRTNDNYQFFDAYKIVAGHQQIKFGADLKRRLTQARFLTNQNGTYNFFSLEQFFNNTPAVASISIGPNKLNFSEFDQAYFFEDTIRLRENLTLSLGVRYENFGQPINILNELTRRRESDPTTAIFNTNLPLEARTFANTDTDNNNFAPRIGFAFTPHFAKSIFGEDKTVIRGGYGISYDLAFYNILVNAAASSPVVLASTIQTANNGKDLALPLDPTGPGIRGALSPFVPLGQDPRLLSRTNISNDFHSPYTEQYSLGIQRQFGNNSVFEARYVGTHAVGQFQSVNANPRFDALIRDFPQFVPSGIKPSPNNGRLVASEGLTRTRINGASSTYNSLQLRFDTRIGNQLSLGTTYTFSKQIDNTSDILSDFLGGNTIAVAQDIFNSSKGERSLGAFDFRNVFTVNFIYDLPFFRDQHGLKEKLLGGFELAGTFRALPGQFYTPVQAFFDSPYSDVAFSLGLNNRIETLRPFLSNVKAPEDSVAVDTATAIASYQLDDKTTSPTGFLSLNALNSPSGPQIVPVSLDQVHFVANTKAAALLFGSPYGTAGRNSLQGDNFAQGNFAIFKNTKFSERINLQLRVEFFNVFNHPYKGVPDPFINNAGTIFANVNENSLSLSQNNNGRRTIQFGLKLFF